MKWSEKMKQKYQSQTLKENSQGLWKKLKMDKFIRKMDLYIIKKFLGTYFFAIAFLLGIILITLLAKGKKPENTIMNQALGQALLDGE